MLGRLSQKSDPWPQALPHGKLDGSDRNGAGISPPEPNGARGPSVDIYHVWCDLKPGISDLQFSDQVAAYMDQLKSGGLIEGWRLTRRKLGLGPAELGEFHLSIEVRNLGQLDNAFQRVASRTEPIEGFHFGVNSLVRNARFALYRDFPDPVRQRGAEKF